jgi:hypothetical protein
LDGDLYGGCSVGILKEYDMKEQSLLKKRAKISKSHTSREMIQTNIFMKKLVSVFVLLMATVLLPSCTSMMQPSSFVKATDGGSWSTIFIREDLEYDKAFDEILDICAKRFEMDMISKEAGYIRTNWVYTWGTNGKYSDKYRTRATFKFSPDKTKLDIKTEAEFATMSGWIRGFDTGLLQTVKQDVSGVVGRSIM